MEKFKVLEEKIRLAAERIQHLKVVRIELEQQVASLRDEQRGLKDRVAELEAERAGQAASFDELDRLREERTEIKQRVESLINELAGLDLEEAPVKKKPATAGSRKASTAKSAAAGG
jgi:peptidoglycan hydrolase CwlO-like protein